VKRRSEWVKRKTGVAVTFEVPRKIRRDRGQQGCCGRKRRRTVGARREEKPASVPTLSQSASGRALAASHMRVDFPYAKEKSNSQGNSLAQ